MLEKIKAKRNLFFIGIGILLICAGLAGNLFTFVQSETPKINGAFRYVEKVDKPVVVASEPTTLVSQPTEIPPLNSNVEENIISKNGLSKYSYFIHPTINKALEVPLIPDRIEIPAINLVAPINIADFNFTKVEGETFGQWMPPSEFAAAWHPDSALIGQKGNTVINGHHNEFGEVFGKLIDLKSGDFIYIFAKGKKYTYVIANIMILLEKGQPVEVRQANAKWIGKTDDERLTLITCWPKTNNTHRLIIVARPYE
jgi:sortase A